MYAGDLPHRDEEWLAAFADLVNPYLDTLSPGAYARLPRAERVVLQLVRDRRLSEARLAARGLGNGVAPREVTTDADGRTYWGKGVPASADARRELDLTELELDTRPFPGAQFRHEITGIARGPGAAVDLAVRTYDPALRLPGRPAARGPPAHPRPAPPHGPLPPLPRPPRRLRGPRPRRPRGPRPSRRAVSPGSATRWCASPTGARATRGCCWPRSASRP
ncbi:hypothetical protein GCM10019016_111420 [Streptomyces prasinosporus]|uniref:Uncharacterized protein n=1 Tax=Streptomyces prasinosporus TaxID=68256 RepID=A0ABP6U9A4_9ACTN